MRNKNFDRIKKTFALLLLLFFVLSITAASASASGNSNYGKTEDGYKDGYDKGSEDGKIQAKKDCEQYGSRDVLSKIPSPPDSDGWTEYYKDNYKNVYEKGYVDGYNQIRYGCLK
jgi:hypothetical protein